MSHIYIVFINFIFLHDEVLVHFHSVVMNLLFL